MKLRVSIIIFALLYGIGYFFFYFRYVPQIHSIQWILVPLILFSVILTSVSIRLGTLCIVFLIPMVNSLPYFFNLKGFNPLFFIFFGSVLGILIHQIIHPIPLQMKNPLTLPMFGAMIVLIVSALLTLWRYSNFFPIYDPAIYEFSVNVLNVRAGEAIRRVFFDSLNWLAGFIWFIMVLSTIQTKKMIQKAVVLLAASTSISFVFGLYQALKNPRLGNTDFFIALDRINALFTDPNAFGVYLSLSLPLFTGVLLTFKTRWKPLFVSILLGSLFLIPHSGSRSGFFGIILSFIILIFFSAKIVIKQRKNIPRLLGEPKTYIAIILILLALISFLISFYSESSLYERIVQNLKVLSKKKTQEIILFGRQQFWQSAYYMVQEFPFSGIGVGSFTCELPNYYQKYKIVHIMPPSFYQKIPPHGILIDSAGNYYLQVASELGLIGLFFFCWMFYLILRHIYINNFKQKVKSDWKFFKAGLSVGIIVLFFMFLFGVHTLNFEIQLSFWLFVGLLYNIVPPEEARLRSKLPEKIITGLLIGIFGLSYTWNFFHTLSLQSRTEEFNLIQEFGFYPKEHMNEQEFRWTKKTAGIKLQVKKPILHIPIHASHPDIRSNPIVVEVYSSKDLLKNRELLNEIVLKDNSQQYFEFNFSGELNNDVLLLFKISRTWQPIKFMRIPDKRHLGIGIGELKFDELPLTGEEKPVVKGYLISKFSRLDWNGKQGGNLIWNDRCWIETSLPDGELVFKVSAKGERAKGEWPYMIVWLNDEMIGGEWVTSDDWEFYHFQKNIKRGQYKISVEFINDNYAESPKEDRNLFVGDLEIFQFE